MQVGTKVTVDGWMAMMMKSVANKVKLNGLLSGECCYRGGTTAFACPGPDWMCFKIGLH